VRDFAFVVLCVPVAVLSLFVVCETDKI